MLKYSPSINIARDRDTSYQYVKTANAISVASSIDANFELGKHSFVVIGSYGTGKSSLMWAIEQSLSSKKKFFEFPSLPKKNSKFLNLVGSYQSIVEAFADLLGVKNSLKGNQLLLDKVHQLYESTGKDGLLVIQIDEMGKFLEFALDHNSKADLYFLQQLAELVNSPKENILLITTLHQNFESYSIGLNEVDRNEWTKIKGRFEIIAFNEPVEQLLMLASESLSVIPKEKGVEPKIEAIAQLLSKHNIVSFKQEYLSSIKGKLFPLDIISASFLTIALQKYGQNERSLFSFINSRELKIFRSQGKSESTFFDLIELHDYLWSNFYSLLNSKSNPHLNVWTDIRDSIEAVENLNLDRQEELVGLIKVIGMFQLFASKGSSIDAKLLEGYLRITRNTEGVDLLIDSLKAHKWIRYNHYNKSFKLIQGTDLDIEGELRKASDRVDSIVNVVDSLGKHFKTPSPVLAKRISLEKGTPRLFNYHISEEPISEKEASEFDGTINLVLNSTVKRKDIETLSEIVPNVLYAAFNSADKIKAQLFEIEKSEKVIAENASDKVAIKELKLIIEAHKNLLHHYFLDGVFGKDVVWIWNGKTIKIKNKRELNAQLSSIAEGEYPLAPGYRNELINRNKISSQISSARNDLFKRLVNQWHEKDLGFEENFPPDKTIYISLLRETGIHRKEKDQFGFGRPSKGSSFSEVWNECEAFLNDSKDERQPISDLYQRLEKEPFGLTRGLIETFVPIFLFIKRDDFALFGDDGYIPEINETFLSLFIRNPQEYKVKAFNLKGVNLDLFNRYRDFLNQRKETSPSNKSFIESIRPFLVFYKQLPEYTKNTTRLSKEAKAIREAIVKAQDPEQTFFDAFPRALNTSIKELNSSQSALQSYTNVLKEKITELRSAYDELLNRFEKCVAHELGIKSNEFNEYKSEITERYKKVKSHMLLNYQKTFVQRVNTELDDRGSWLSSIAQALIGKSLESIKDEDESVLYDKFKTIVHELDNLLEVSNVKHDSEKERVFKFEITSEKLIEKSLVRIPKTKFSTMSKLETEVKKALNEDKMLNIAVLTKLLQEQLKK